MIFLYMIDYIMDLAVRGAPVRVVAIAITHNSLQCEMDGNPMADDAYESS